MRDGNLPPSRDRLERGSSGPTARCPTNVFNSRPSKHLSRCSGLSLQAVPTGYHPCLLLLRVQGWKISRDGLLRIAVHHQGTERASPTITYTPDPITGPRISLDRDQTQYIIALTQSRDCTTYANTSSRRFDRVR